MISAGNTALLLIAVTFVFLMTPGLAFFYGGLSRRKNVLNTMMSSIFIIGLASLMWVMIGYSLSFSGDNGGIIGTLQAVGLKGIGADPGEYSDSLPALLFAAFQMMFAIITPALITGAVAGRMKFKALFLFIAVWSVIVYYPMAHMVGRRRIFGGDRFGGLCRRQCSTYQFRRIRSGAGDDPRKAQRVRTDLSTAP